MKGVIRQPPWMIVVFIVALVIAIIFFSFIRSQGPGGFGFQSFKTLILDSLYLMFGPKIPIN